MDKKYIRQIIGKLKCSKKKRKEIGQQLTAEFMAGIENGESTQEIIKRMGTPIEIAEDFNNSFTQEEQKKYRREKWIGRLAVIGMIFVMLAAVVYWALPKAIAIEDSKIFEKEETEELAKEVIRLFNEEDYDKLHTYSIEKMKEVLNKESMDEIKEVYIGEDWGAFETYGNIYMAQISQMQKKSVAVQIGARYENVNVTYTLYFNEDMKLEGFWMR